jgi:hypothetical protein
MNKKEKPTQYLTPSKNRKTKPKTPYWISSKETEMNKDKIITIGMILATICFFYFYLYTETGQTISCIQMELLTDPMNNGVCTEYGYNTDGLECLPAPCGFFEGGGCYSCRGYGLVKQEVVCRERVPYENKECERLIRGYNPINNSD